LNMGTVCTSTNAVLTSFFSAVKVKSIKVWSAGDESVSGTPAPATVCVNWTGYSNSPNTLVVDSSISTAFPAHVSARPPRQSLANFWQSCDSNSVICQINVGSTHTTIEVELEGVLYSLDPASTLTHASMSVSVATLAEVYYPALDLTTGHTYPPLYLITAF
jgi:hypothetical protein